MFYLEPDLNHGAWRKQARDNSDTRVSSAWKSWDFQDWRGNECKLMKEWEERKKIAAQSGHWGMESRPPPRPQTCSDVGFPRRRALASRGRGQVSRAKHQLSLQIISSDYFTAHMDLPFKPVFSRMHIRDYLSLVLFAYTVPSLRQRGSFSTQISFIQAYQIYLFLPEEGLGKQEVSDEDGVEGVNWK